MNRIEKIKSYCCIGLFSSVEEAVPEDDVNVKCTKLRDESVWFIEVPAKIVGGGNMIYHCPWCGVRLPPKPYIDNQ